MSQNAFIDLLRQLRAVVARQNRSRAELANFYAQARLASALKGVTDPKEQEAVRQLVQQQLLTEYGQYDHEWTAPSI